MSTVQPSTSRLPRYTISNLFTVLFVVAVALGLFRWGVDAINREFHRVHSSETEIANHIKALGGSYSVDRGNDHHIVDVYLSNTSAKDEDVAMVSQLPQLRYLELKNTHVTKASLDVIAGHPRLRGISVKGTVLTSQDVFEVMSHPHSQLEIVSQ